ncbi:hypothetical protein LY28_03020 [Ruminiclostridium sufflavum DSM 19573]|uniref:Uncharacterized protein n=1 Tax=Ruminiclostridium sufflavum DSM 19573 TaxID=1121337 RepID=A0A318XJG3_9FIRM|nr:hypothetical protein [Ruminiclostridium sufflavum]PYG85868.1 hypothetical protein LY28_03020 [Ruminiclostridium sufflavum DSM 19573]
MKLCKKKSSRHKKNCGTKHYEKIELDAYLQDNIQGINFNNFIGRTVTIYVNCGGPAGSGFTGVLMGLNSTYVSLLVLPSTPPSCSLSSECSAARENTLICSSCPFNDNAALGAVAEIAVSCIVAFCHNN